MWLHFRKLAFPFLDILLETVLKRRKKPPVFLVDSEQCGVEDREQIQFSDSWGSRIVISSLELHE